MYHRAYQGDHTTGERECVLVDYVPLPLPLSLSRHVVYAPSSVNAYGSSAFPGVSDAIFSALESGGSWDVVREQLDLVRVHILYASHIMDQQYQHPVSREQREEL